MSGVSDFKNYSNEVDLFLDWINDYIHRSVCGYIGWYRYEEDDFPTVLIRRNKEGPVIHRVDIRKMFNDLDQADKLLSYAPWEQDNDYDSKVNEWLIDRQRSPWE